MTSIYLIEIPTRIKIYQLDSTNTTKNTNHTKREKKWNDILECLVASKRLDVDVNTSINRNLLEIAFVLEIGNLGSNLNFHNPTNRIMWAPTIIHLIGKSLSPIENICGSK